MRSSLAQMKAEIEIKNLDHLGLVAGLIDELEIESIVNEAVGIDSREKVTAGKIVKGIILNGLDFVSKPLYLFPNFFTNKPVGELLGKGIKASEINEDKIGRVMDKIWKYSLGKLWINIAIKAINKYQISTKYSHLDSTSISVQGEYKVEEAGTGSIEITHGYSRDRRPDLKQFMIDLMVSSDGDVPLLIRMGSGNESDKTIFGELINNYKANFDLSTIYVADCALYTAKNLHNLGNTKWLTRVPLTSKKAQEIIKNIPESEFIISQNLNYKYKEQEVNHHGIKQRWLIVLSAMRQRSDQAKIEKKAKKERDKIEKQLDKWQKNAKNIAEIKAAVKEFIKKLKYHRITDIEYIKKLNKQQKDVYTCQGIVQEKSDVIAQEMAQSGKFILATNVLNSEELSSSEILSEYKAQQSCERGFRFLKDPLFLADSVFLKNPQRIETMGMLMGLCLLVYSIGQRQIRNELQKRGEVVKNQLGKLIDRPTLRWIFQELQGIHVVLINGEKMVSNLTEKIIKILQYFSVSCQKYYLIN
jgi:transposase